MTTNATVVPCFFHMEPEKNQRYRERKIVKETVLIKSEGGRRKEHYRSFPFTSADYPCVCVRNIR